MSEQSQKEPPEQAEFPVDLVSAIRERILARDSRFALAAYLFLYQALAYTQKMLKRDNPQLEAAQRHVTGQELLEGIRLCAAEEFGPLAPTVFRNWGLRASADFGEIVFNLVECHLLGKTDSDKRDDFAGGFDFDTAFEGPVAVKPE